MKKLEYIYFTIYSHYGQRSYFPDSYYVRLSSMYILSLSVGGWILLLQSLFLKFVRNAWFTSHGGAMLFALTVYGTITAVLHHIFIVKEYDQKICSKFSSSWDNNANKRRDVLIASFVAAIPYLLMVFVKIVGSWQA